MFCFIDTETTGLDPRIHQAWEICIWREDSEKPQTWQLGHTLEHADPKALEINNYFARAQSTRQWDAPADRSWLAQQLTGVTLVGSNPSFDAAMVRNFLGYAPWSHRMVDISNLAMAVFDLEAPPGLTTVRDLLIGLNYDIPPPNHTAYVDVLCTKAVFDALRIEIGLLHGKAQP